MGVEYSSFGRISMLKAVSLTSGLHGPRVLLIMPRTLFTPRHEWLAESGWPISEYLSVLGLILFVIGR